MNHQPAPQHTALGRRLTRSLLTAGAIALIATSCGADASESASAKIEPEAAAAAPVTTPPPSTHPETSTTTTPRLPIAGPVLIEATSDFTGDQVVGPFEVSEGADVLGCTSGSFVDTEVSTGIRRVMTCESGERTGTITVHFVPGDDPGPGDANGPWSVENGTEGFVGLQGEGDFSVTFHEETRSGTETLGGEIRYGPPEEADASAPDDAETTDESSAATSELVLDAEFLAEQMNALTVPEDIGALMIAVVEGDETIWAADGADPTGNAPTPSDPFRVGSISKVFTSLTTLSLVDDGLIGLDDPVVDHVSRVTVPDDVTVRHLLQHTSGVRNYTNEFGFFDDVLNEEGRRWSAEEIVELVSEGAPQFPAGAEFSYSNTNFIILAIMIEEITGQPFSEVLRARVIDPVGMPNTYLAGAEDGPEPFGAYSTVSGDLAPIDFDYTSIATSAWSAGAMVSSAEDLHALFTALYDNQIISTEMLAEMTANEEYGLGLQLWDPAKSAIGHGGDIPGYHTLVFHSPATGKTAFWVSSGDALSFGPSVDDVVEALINEPS